MEGQRSGEEMKNLPVADWEPELTAAIEIAAEEKRIELTPFAGRLMTPEAAQVAAHAASWEGAGT